MLNGSAQWAEGPSLRVQTRFEAAQTTGRPRVGGVLTGDAAENVRRTSRCADWVGSRRAQAS